MEKEGRKGASRLVGEIQIELGAEEESECVSWKISQMRQAGA
jgi:hypothetical protein